MISPLRIRRAAPTPLVWELVRRGRNAAIGHFSLAGITIAAAWPRFAQSYRFWALLALIAITSLVRLALSRIAERDRHISARIARTYRAAIHASGVAWCALGFLVFQRLGTHDPLSVILLLVLCGIVAGASSSLAPCLGTFRAFALLLCLPPIVCTFTSGTSEWAMRMLPLITLAYFGFLMKQARLQNEQLTELARQEQELRDAEARFHAVAARSLNSARMASLGEMASGVAHEINNPLAILSAKAQMLVSLGELGKLDAERVRSTARSLIQTCDRIARIVKGLRTFAREGSSDPFDSVAAADIVAEALDLCRARFLNHGVELKVQPVDPSLVLDCRKTQVEQVLINLLNNAFDAVETRERPWVEVAVEERDETVVFRVTDSGTGIPDSVAAKLAQPFFTTKEVGRGTGLGLSISTGIVRQHGGSLTLVRDCPHTRFEMELPKAQQMLQQAA